MEGNHADSAARIQKVYHIVQRILQYLKLLIPATLRKFAGIEKDVVLAGLLNRIEIWSEEKWNENNNYEEIDMDEIAGQLTELGLDI